MKHNHSDSQKRKLLDLKEKLKDVELERKMTFNQNGLHIWSNEVSDQFLEFDREIETYKEQISELEEKQKN